MDNEEIPAGYARVTEVLKPFTPFATLDPESVYAYNVRCAADRGKRVHKYCEAYVQGLFVEDVDEDCKNYVEGFKRWFDDMVLEVVCTEQRINSEEYRLSGAVDLVCRLKGDELPTIVDLKTPLQPSLTWQLQTAAYRLLLRKELGIDSERRMCVKLPKYKDAEIYLYEFKNHREDERLFINALELYRFCETSIFRT